jgi:hypothetical protein
MNCAIPAAPLGRGICNGASLLFGLRVADEVDDASAPEEPLRLPDSALEPIDWNSLDGWSWFTALRTPGETSKKSGALRATSFRRTRSNDQSQFILECSEILSVAHPRRPRARV